MKITDYRKSWSDGATTWSDVLTLNPANRRDQWIGDASVLRDGDRRIITVAGDSRYSETGVGDAFYVVIKNADGSFRIPKLPTLAYAPPDSGVCVNYLGTGPGTTVGPTTSAGYRFFGIISVEDRPHSWAWLAWIVSRDGVTWDFVAANGGTTREPLMSRPIISRADRALEATPGIPRFWHSVMTYAAGYFYAVVGFATSFGGIVATWWRIEAAGPFGFIRIWRNDGATWVEEAQIPADDSWASRATDLVFIDPDDTPVDPMSLIPITRIDGSFDSFMFLYFRAATIWNDTPEIIYTRGRPGVWDAPRVLDLTPVLSSGFVRPCPTRNAPHNLGLIQEGWKNGAPTFTGYLAMGRPDQCVEQGAGLSSNGLLELSLEGDAPERSAAMRLLDRFVVTVTR